jgi:hypothetical protein
MKDIDVYISLMEDLKEIRSKLDKMEMKLNSEIESASGRKGVSMIDTLELPAPLRTIVLELTKYGSASSSDLSDRTGFDKGKLVEDLETLKNMGFITEIVEGGERKYKVALSRRQPKKAYIDLWSALEKKINR